MKNILTITVISVCGVLPVYVSAEQKEVVMPLIPVSSLTVKQVETIEPKKKVELKPVVINARPGVNEIVAISDGHINRIVTPFTEPRVVTVSDAEIQKSDNVLYVSSKSSAPVTLFVTQKGSEMTALSLTLIPRKIPPQEVFLSSNASGSPVDGGSVSAVHGLSGIGAGYVNRPAQRWETKQDYLETIKTVMVSLAKGNMPSGYQMSPLRNVTHVISPPVCEQSGVTFDWSNGQALFGHHLNATVGLAYNSSDRDLEIKPTPCIGIAAFSTWPEIYLKPGEKTEVYVIRKQNETKTVRTSRPSLLN